MSAGKGAADAWQREWACWCAHLASAMPACKSGMQSVTRSFVSCGWRCQLALHALTFPLLHPSVSFTCVHPQELLTLNTLMGRVAVQ